MVLKLGFSTCPNDTYIFDALVHHKIDTEGIEFDVVMTDVEELNRSAFQNEIDITKLSYHAYMYACENYKLLNSGSALGHANGPLLVSKRKIYPDEIHDLNIAIPGKFTTANLLLGIAYPRAKNKKEYVFSDIEELILSQEVDAGLMIHENRFTYDKRGLKKIVDLGEYWESETKMPIPLGGIVVNRKLSHDIHQTIDRLIRNSLEYANKNPNSSLSFIKQFAQEMDQTVMKKHIDLYVNNYSLNLGETGRKAVSILFQKAYESSIAPKVGTDIFV